MANPNKRLATVKQAAQLYPALTESSFRWLIFNSKHYHFDSCLIRIGRKVLLDLDSFEAWIEKYKDMPAANDGGIK